MGNQNAWTFAIPHSAVKWFRDHCLALINLHLTKEVTQKEGLSEELTMTSSWRNQSSCSCLMRSLVAVLESEVQDVQKQEAFNIAQQKNPVQNKK